MAKEELLRMKKLQHIISIKLVFAFIVVLCNSGFSQSNNKKIIVDINGKANFTSIQNAIESLSDSSAQPRLLFIKNGIYNEKIFITKHNIILEGESRDKVIITQAIARDEWRCSHPDDWGVATLNIDGNDITLKNLTVINSYGFDNKKDRVVNCDADSLTHKKTITSTGHQMALRTMKATRLKAINVHFKAFAGDTVSPWNVEAGMFYFKDCIMEGGVDFYCPRGWAYAENCRFIANTGSASIWHDGSAIEDSKTVLKNCSFEGFDNFYLGRYHKDAQFYLINCHFAKNMADKDIYLVPTSNVIKWGRRVYYYNCHKEGGDYDWCKDNLATAKGSPSADAINASWVFKGQWNPLSTTAFLSEIKVEITNSSSIERKDELIVFTREDLKKKFGKILDNKFIIVHANNPVAVQLDDLNRDGKWNEAAFLYSFLPKQKVTFSVSIADHPSAVKVAQRSNVRLAKKDVNDKYGEALQQETMLQNAQPNDFTKVAIPLYQVEGPVWENDKVSCRTYFDTRNAKDIFGKTTSAMVMDTVGTYGDKYYHTFDKKWGMDILKVGNSLGAGGLAISIKQNGIDTLIKLAGNNIKQTSYEVIANGPVRSIFRMHYKDWKVAGNTYNVTEEISIWGGQYFYQDKVSITPEANLVTGIVNLHSKQSYQLKKNKAAILYTFDK